VVDEEELDKALRDLDIDSPAMQYVSSTIFFGLCLECDCCNNRSSSATT
jgi:hypothetical protein